MLIYPADVISTLKDADKLGVHATVNTVDFHSIISRMHTLVDGDSNNQARAVEATP